MLERGWLAGGNITRNTTVIRSNYLWDESAAIYEHALQLWEGLEEELDYDLLFSQRGVLNLAHTLQDVRDGVRRVQANVLNGIDAEWLEPDEVAEACPILNVSPRRPLPGARRDLPAARAGSPATRMSPGGSRAAADALGVDLIQGCEVQRVVVEGGRAVGVETSLGRIAAGRVALVAAGHTPVIAETAGLRLPLQTPSAPGARLGALRAGARQRRDVERGARLRQPGAQGRARDGRRDRRATTPTSSAARCT